MAARRLTGIIKDGVDQGMFESPEMASRAVMGITQWVKRWYRPTAGVSVDEISAEFSEFALRICGFEDGH